MPSSTTHFDVKAMARDISLKAKEMARQRKEFDKIVQRVDQNLAEFNALMERTNQMIHREA